MATLTLSDGTRFTGTAFGAKTDTTGEVVFSTGMVGYPESMTDPSFKGQILIFTFPLVGNYGVPSEEKNQWGFSKNLESEKVQVQAIIVDQLSEHFSHQAAVSSLGTWMEHHNIPGIAGIDTRKLTKILREKGVMLGRITQEDSSSELPDSGNSNLSPSWDDPNQRNLVEEVSIPSMETYEPEGGVVNATVVAFDCGMKRNILRSLLARGIKVHRVPWNFDLKTASFPFDGVFISNGPGDPKVCTATCSQIQWSILQGIPTFGICLGNQLLALSIGGDTYKLKYGHRGVNQPCVELSEDGSVKRCIITSQNHGFAVSDKLPSGWRVWFRNANDNTVEGIRHESGKYFSVQFHPEASPGPEDANYLFDEFLAVMKK